MNNLVATFVAYKLKFKRPSGTSRGVLLTKDTYFIYLAQDLLPPKNPIFGVGEAALFRGLSCDDRADYEEVLAKVCANPRYYLTNLSLLADYPSIVFGLETAWLSLQAAQQDKFNLFNNDFVVKNQGIATNGLIWMGQLDFMLDQLALKVAAGFDCIKIKIGGLDFASELSFLQHVRQRFGYDLELRLDANGAFTADNALAKLEQLAPFKIHSLEQPIKAGNWREMAQIVANSPIKIALDEELIGLNDDLIIEQMLSEINPDYVIFKPALVGGFTRCEKVIAIAKAHEIDSWITSALESNIGLNAIAQWTFSLLEQQKIAPMKQGLGTGSLFSNNFSSPLEIVGQNLFYQAHKTWNFEV